MPARQHGFQRKMYPVGLEMRGRRRRAVLLMLLRKAESVAYRLDE
jgi:hypothetical protein